MFQKPIFQACEYDIISKDALVWEKVTNGYSLNLNPVRFYHHVNSNSLNSYSPSFQTDNFQILVKTKDCILINTNIKHIINDLIRMLILFPSIHITITTSTKMLDMINKMINKIINKNNLNNFNILRIQFISEKNETVKETQSNINININIYLNHYLNHYLIQSKSEDKKLLSFIFRKLFNLKKNMRKNIISKQKIWEIQYLDHNHGFQIYNL